MISDTAISFIVKSKKDAGKINKIDDLGVEYFEVADFLNLTKSHFDNDIEIISGLTLPVVNEYIEKFDAISLANGGNVPILFIMHIKELNIKAAVLSGIIAAFVGTHDQRVSDML